MSRKSPLTVEYKDLVQLAEGLEKEAARKLSNAKSCGIGNLNGLTHHYETTKTLARMLRKGLKTKETDMVTLFNETL